MRCRSPLTSLCALLLGCTNALLEPRPLAETTLDDRLQIRGTVCTSAPSPTDFPVKVEFLIDKSGSMCVSDGPGSQTTGGLCEVMGNWLRSQGVTTPGRVRSMLDLLANNLAPHPNVYVAMDPFESKISSPYPTDGFVPASDGALPARVRALQADLGKGTDYQGALAAAYARIEKEILRVNPAELPRTRFVVILLTDGTPYPRCSASDDLPTDQYATVDHPERVWKDNPPDFCNANDASDTIPGFVGKGTDRNQNYQIWDGVDQLMSLKQKYNIGDIRLHTILLFNTAGVAEAVAIGGPVVLQDLYNGMATPQDAEKVAIWTLQQMAAKGGGTFQEFTDTASIALGSLDYGSLASRFVSKTLMARNEFAFPTLTGPVPDSDGDGLPDDQDNPQTVGTSRFDTDTDRDGFSDAFEEAHRAEGFDPLVPDPRGCLSVAGKFTAKYDCSDTDKDNVLLPEEVYLGTNPTLVDSDADGIPDGIEVALGLDPAKANDQITDLDTDGVPDVLEALFHTNPLIDDRAVHASTQYRYQVTPRVDEANNRNCYDFLISNLKLVKTDRATGQVGFNYITVSFGEAPESGVQRDYGSWRQACVMAQFAPPSVRVPQGPEVVLQDSDFVLFRDLPRQRGSIMPPDGQVNGLCKGAPFPPP